MSNSPSIGGQSNTATDHVPYQRPFPPDTLAEIVVPNILTSSEADWVPQSEGVDFRPLCFGVSQGYFVNLLRVRKSGMLSRHYHTNPVHAYVVKGRWFYLEHDWVAEEGSYAMEPPGETHTLIVPDDVSEMITLFHVTGAYVYVDPDGTPVRIEDVFTKLANARKHYEKIGLGPDYVRKFIR
jgi:2,4'-dihydroxyacetophenone dioxygenase